MKLVVTSLQLNSDLISHNHNLRAGCFPRSEACWSLQTDRSNATASQGIMKLITPQTVLISDPDFQVPQTCSHENNRGTNIECYNSGPCNRQSPKQIFCDCSARLKGQDHKLLVLSVPKLDNYLEILGQLVRDVWRIHGQGIREMFVKLYSRVEVSKDISLSTHTISSTFFISRAFLQLIPACCHTTAPLQKHWLPRFPPNYVYAVRLFPVNYGNMSLCPEHRLAVDSLDRHPD